jgi:membrane protease YdiL (CAAX protease family)
MAEVLFVFPVLLVYHVGTHLTDVRNGVDLVSALLALLYARLPWAVLVVDGVIVASFVSLYVYARRKERFALRMLWTVVAESTLYALTMGTVIVVLLIFVFGLQPPILSTKTVDRWVEVVFVSSGAGFYEELIFRLLMYGGTVWLLENHTRLHRSTAVAIGMVVSAGLFALAHHVPPQGEALAVWPFAFRALAGLVFAAIYELRGFSVAVYTHTLYDIYVLGFAG